MWVVKELLGGAILVVNNFERDELRNPLIMSQKLCHTFKL